MNKTRGLTGSAHKFLLEKKAMDSSNYRISGK